MARILIADDERSIRTTLSDFVKEDGREVFIAEGAAEGFYMLQERPTDVVVTDIILPHVAGVALLGQIQETWLDVQVIMISGEPSV